MLSIDKSIVRHSDAAFFVVADHERIRTDDTGHGKHLADVLSQPIVEVFGRLAFNRKRDFVNRPFVVAHSSAAAAALGAVVPPPFLAAAFFAAVFLRVVFLRFLVVRPADFPRPISSAAKSSTAKSASTFRKKSRSRPASSPVRISALSACSI